MCQTFFSYRGQKNRLNLPFNCILILKSSKHTHFEKKYSKMYKIFILDKSLFLLNDKFF